MPAPIYGRACVDCRHCSRVGSCLEPVSAGLASHHCIRWPRPMHAARCPAFEPRAQESAQERLKPAPRSGPCPVDDGAASDCLEGMP